MTLNAYTSGAFRWMDAAGNLYSAAYRDSYSYTQATVVITYSTRGGLLTGTMLATALKPNFAYQLKLSGLPETYPTANEKLGYSGRWWKEEWNGTAWVNGWNLNDKGTGYFPTPNDVTYLALKDVPDASSPTGGKYRFTGYRPFEYFVTDSNGCASVAFAVRNTYHVLWRTSQRPAGSGDGPIKAQTIDPAFGDPAYDTDYPAATVAVYGEWERLPADRILLPTGAYALEFLLTEESFHDAGLGGWWAHACHGLVQFTIQKPRKTGGVISIR